MSIVYTYPSKTIITPTLEVKDQNLDEIIDELIRAAVKMDGVGMAANQLGYDYQLFVAQLDNDGDWQTIINPKILEYKGSTKTEEGCFSLPGFFEYVERAAFIRASWTDRHTGNEVFDEFRDQAAVIFQHEYDHLQGKTILNRVSPVVRKMIVNKIKKLNKIGQWQLSYEV